MDRQTFLDRIIPGLKELRTASDLKQGFGENPPVEVSDEIHQLTRRGILKIANAFLSLALPLSILTYNKLQTKKIGTELYDSMTRRILDELHIDDSELSDTYQKVEEDGSLSTQQKTDGDSETGLNYGFSSTNFSHYNDETHEYFKFEIIQKDASIQAFSDDQPMDEPFSLSQNIRVGVKYMIRKKINKFIFKVPVICHFLDQDQKLDLTLQLNVPAHLIQP